MTITQTAAVDHELSQFVSERIPASIKQCWFNARRALFDHRLNLDAVYVEGWATTKTFITIEHGWLETEKSIIDPTLYSGQLIRYFPALRFDRVEAWKLLKGMGSEIYQPFAWHCWGWGGGDNAEYMAAFQAALSFTEQQHESTRPLAHL